MKISDVMKKYSAVTTPKSKRQDDEHKKTETKEVKK